MRRYLFICCSLSFFFGCKPKPVKQNVRVAVLSEAIGITPKADTLQKPIVTLLDSCPKLKTIKIASKPSAAVKPAGFSVPIVSYAAEQGLYSSISCILEDRKGNLWFGTDGAGVSRYDGKAITTFSTQQGLVNSSVWGMCEDTKGNIWFATDGGVSYYDGKTFTSFTRTKGLAYNRVEAVCEDRHGNMWFATTGGGVSCYNGKTFTNYTLGKGLPSFNVWNVFEDANGNMWFATDEGATRYDGKRFITFGRREGMSRNVKSICQDKKGVLWFATGEGVSSYDGISFTNYTLSQDKGANSAWYASADREGNIWFGTDGGGVFRYDGKVFTNFSTRQGLTNDVVFCACEDKSGNMWFGTDGGGACRYDGRAIVTFSTAQGLPNSTVWCVVEDRYGDLWFGTDDGLSRYTENPEFNHPGTFTTFTTTQGLPDNSISCSYRDKKHDLWFGTESGVTHYDGDSFTTISMPQGLPDSKIKNIFEDNDSNMWFCTDEGVSCYKGKTLITYTTQQGLPVNDIRCVCQDKDNNIWIATEGGGVCKYNGKIFTIYNDKAGLANNNVRAILKDENNNLWFGTDGGCSRYDGKTFLNFSTLQGLSNNSIFATCEDTNHNIWLGTNEGFSGVIGYRSNTKPDEKIKADNSLSNAELTKNYVPVFENYNFKNGYPVKDINTGAMFIDSKDIIWAGTGDRLVRFDYSGVRKDKNVLHVCLQSISLQDEKISWYDLLNKRMKEQDKHSKKDSMAAINEEVYTFGSALSDLQQDSLLQKYADIEFDSITPDYPLPENLVLPYHHNNVTFNYAAVEPAKPYLVKYQYILEGYDNEWNPVTDKTFANFGNIREGEYTFKLRAKGVNGIWNNPIAYHFRVLPPWYRTWWAYILYVLLAGILLYGVFYWRTKQLIKVKEHLEQVVVERTAELVKQNEEVEKQKILLEEKNKDITDSITYAKRLQDAILPPTARIKEIFPESFVMYKPKDIVAGDFYWMDKLGDTILLAACDCTGHGVPGAMVSVVCSNALNRALKEFRIRDTGKLLDQTRDIVIETFEKSQSNVNDGMDISFCAINIKESRLEWSGANNPLWYIRNSELKEIEPDKQSISKQDGKKPFTTHTLNLQKGDILYLFTDGYADQFGGPKGKKLKYRQLMETLVSSCKKPLEEQRNILENKFADWRGGLEQVDDVLIVGVRI